MHNSVKHIIATEQSLVVSQMEVFFSSTGPNHMTLPWQAGAWCVKCIMMGKCTL